LYTIISYAKNIELVYFAFKVKMLKVCLVSYNNPDYVIATIDSIVKLEIDLEIVIVDSSTNLVILEYLNRDVKLPFRYYWEPKQGIYHAMNTAWRNCNSSDIIWYLNPGDRLFSGGALCSLVSKIENSGYVWGFGQAVIEGDKYEVFPESQTKIDVESLNSGELRISHQAILVKQHVLKGLGGFQENYLITADLDLEFKLLNLSIPYFEKNIIINVNTEGVSYNRVVKTLVESAKVRKDNGLLTQLQVFHWLSSKLTKKVLLHLKMKWFS
jgi:glycosyltransferase involved in cell wall biosynthesis